MEAPEPQEGNIRNAGELLRLLTDSLENNARSNWARAAVNVGIFLVSFIALILYAGGGC
jgi:hypothetical protein